MAKSKTTTARKNTGSSRVNTNANRIKSRGSASAGKKTKKKSPAYKKQEESIEMSNEIQVIVSCGLMLVLTLSNFGLCGSFGNILSNFFFGIFGCVQYVMPVAFFVGITVLAANDYSTLSIKKCTAGFLILTMISSMVQLFYPKPNLTVHDLFSESVNNHLSGGIVGGGIAVSLKEMFGMWGSLIIIICILLLSIVMVTQKSAIAFFKKCYAAIKGMLGRQREHYKQRREERRSEEDKVSVFQKVKRKTVLDREREKQCEEKVREIEEKQSTARQEASKLVSEEQDEAFSVPVFKPSDEVKRKDSVKELHPEIYPFTKEDGKTKPFEDKLDFTAFSFNSGKSPEEFDEELELHKHQNIQEAEQGLILAKGMTEIESESQEPEFAEMTEEITIHSEEEEHEVMEVEFKDEESESTGLPETIPALSQSMKSSKKKEDSMMSKKESPKKNVAEGEAATAQIIDIKPATPKEYIFPPMNLLENGKEKRNSDFEVHLKETAIKLQQTLASFGVNVTITDISCGPTVTRYELFPEHGTKVSKIVSLTDDIKLNLAAPDIRIEAPIPGKSAIGIEVPNKQNLTVHFRELIDNNSFHKFKSKLAFAVGKDLGGKIVLADIAKMPHLLIAGATGSGKSVCINTLIMSILYKARPDEVKLIMIDPKMVELSTYNGIPHLLIPVVTDPKKASGALNWAVAEMTDRYNKFTECGVRNIQGYNDKMAKLIKEGEVDAEKMHPMPQILIIIDELADLMMVAPGEVEDAIVRLSQLARAAGIHLVIATQRPSVNVITGLIKANVPSRIAFSVSSGIDSRTIIDMNGAEKLLGKGDMLFYPSGYQKPIRVQGAFISDEEIQEVVDFLKENEDVAVYDDKVTEKIEKKLKTNAASQERDEYFEQAARFIMEKDKATIGMLQRMFKIGFNRAARIIDQLAEAGIVGPEEGTKPRKILMSPEQLEQYFEETL